MSTENYQAAIHVDASPKTAFENVCRANEWWGNITGPTSKAGDEFTYTVGSTWVKFKITEMAPNKKIVWSVTDSNLPWLKDIKEWNGTSVVFDITPGEGFTEIKMHHMGLTPDLECYENCNAGWNHYIHKSLYNLITEGVGVLEK